MQPEKDSCYRGETAETRAWKAANVELENKQLRKRVAELENILCSVPVHIVTINPDGELTYVNYFSPELYDKVVGHNIRDFVSEEDGEILAKALEQALKEGKPQKARVRSLASNTIQQARYAPLKMSDGSTAIVGATFDATDEHEEVHALQESKEKIEAELSDSDERFRTMVEMTPVPVVISDMETGRVLSGNHALAEAFATPYETINQQITGEFYADPAQRQALLERVAGNVPIRGMTMKLKTAEGKTWWAAVYLDRINFAGRPALLACFLDVSVRKQREEEILRDRRALRRLLDTNERDRRLIAYEIHDGVVQDMTGALMFLQTGLSLVSSEADGHQELTRGTQFLSNSIVEIRRLLNGLRPLSLEQGGVIAALDDLVTRMTEGEFMIGFEHEVQFDRLAPSLEMAIYRTVQEGVNNARKHSGAHRVEVSIKQDDKRIVLQIADQGRGFEPGKIDPRRCGISGIRERASLLGGTAQIDSSPGQGTTISVSLPLDDFLDGS
ncbi:Signal transduction histidine-protein kinase/phosphatase DegS [Bremerella volcania]|uniref:histidine kinase n=1 Tax=Bremerella volcania TaxID=2527984 RepID=A0A518C5J6_9BACT|nr:PAS domain-containing sensor histidine kinase [Bremerella volcania]QDU74498.1 Signal transduction histidine-protein kinase/phosphatase DegS [Bremerella volcania]